MKQNVSECNNHSEIERVLFDLMILLEDYLPKNERDLINEFITHGECGLAFENITSCIYYYKVSLSRLDYKKIEQVGLRMNFPESLWSSLKSLIHN